MVPVMLCKSSAPGQSRASMVQAREFLTCVVARKAEWLKNACLAAALLFPAVAALHAITLAALHVDGAVDMDVYGAFQFCSIGILAAPLTVRLSRTYFYDPGRNIIFLWTGLILAGEITRSLCLISHDDSGNPVSLDPSKFSYNTECGLNCSVQQGPHSPMRGGSSNNIYVIPAPHKLTFDTATLLAAACCLPAILTLISMWNKILEINWKSRFGREDEDERIDELIEGTNGATVGRMKGVNALVRLFLSVVEIPVFGAAVLTILIIGERNFFSTQVRYQTEPMASIGQWAPIVGTGLAAIGSLYLLLTTDMKVLKKEEANASPSIHHCNCSMQDHGRRLFTASSHSTVGSSNMRQSSSNSGRGPSTEIAPTTTRSASEYSSQARRSGRVDAGSRLKVAKALTTISNYVGTAAPDLFDDSEFKQGKAVDFPEIPGEEHRNRALPQIREQYNPSRDADGNVTPMLRPRSRAGSFNGSIVSGLNIEHSSTMPGVSTPQSQLPFPLPIMSRTSHSDTFPAEQTSLELQNSPSSSSAAGSPEGIQRRRRDTLEVPLPIHHAPVARNNTVDSSFTSIITMPEHRSSPAIVVSPDPETSSPAHTSDFTASLPPGSSRPPPTLSTSSNALS
ncbi:hypothetical protein B7463_g7840, partial [Scytalidium lignicola]